MRPMHYLTAGLAAVNVAIYRGMRPAAVKPYSGPMPAPYQPKANPSWAGKDASLDAPAACGHHSGWSQYPVCSKSIDFAGLLIQHAPEIEPGKRFPSTEAMRASEEATITDYSTRHFHAKGNLEDAGACYLRALSDHTNEAGTRAFKPNEGIALMSITHSRPVRSVPRSPTQDEAIRQFEAELEKADPTGEIRKVREFGAIFTKGPDGKLKMSEFSVGKDSDRRAGAIASVKLDFTVPGYVLSIHTHPESKIPGLDFVLPTSPSSGDNFVTKIAEDLAKIQGQSRQVEASVLFEASGKKYEYWGAIPPTFNELTQDVAPTRPRPMDMY